MSWLVETAWKYTDVDETAPVGSWKASHASGSGVACKCFQRGQKGQKGQKGHVLG